MTSPRPELAKKIDLRKLLQHAQRELQRDKLERESADGTSKRRGFGKYVSQKIKEVELVLPLISGSSIDSSRSKK